MRNKTTKSGKVVTYLNPAEKAAKAARELKDNRKYTNDGSVKSNAPLTKEERAWRAGYLDSQKASTKAFKSQQKKAGKDYQRKTDGKPAWAPKIMGLIPFVKK